MCAVILLGGGVTDIRGSMGGTVFSRNHGGNTIRNRTKPVNPRSALQSARRAQVAYLSRYWSNTMTSQERTDWRAYAAGTSWTNRLGQSIQINGLAAFLRLNAHIAIYSGTLRHAAPTAMGHAGGVTFTFAAESDTGKLQMDEPGANFDKGVLGHYANIYQGLPTEVGRLATPKGFRYVGSLYGHDSAPMTFPFELTAAYTMAEGQNVTLKLMFNDEDYRMSGPFFVTVEAAPSS